MGRVVGSAIEVPQLATTPPNPASGNRLIYPKSDGWYEKTAAGVESRIDNDPEAPPAYAGIRSNPFNPATSFYNVTETSMARIRKFLAQSQTARIKLVFAGHSITAGSGTSVVGQFDPASQIRRYLSAEQTNVNGTGWVYINNHVGAVPALGRDYRYTTVTGWVAQAGALYPWSGATVSGASAVFQSDAPGTIVEVATFDNTATIQIYVDDVLKDTYTGPNPAAATATVVRQITGLSNTKHKVEVRTTTATGSYLIGIQVRNAYGLEISNVGQGGAYASDWGSGNIATNRLVMANVVGANIAVISLDANEETNGGAGSPVDVNTYKANYQDYLTFLLNAGATVIMHTATPIAGTNNVTQATVNAYLSAQYDLADTNDIPLLDVNHMFMSQALAQSNGWMADTVHPNDVGHAIIARSLANEVLKVYSYDTKADAMATEYEGLNAPTTPANGLTQFTTKKGRNVPSWVDSSGITNEVQPSMFSKRIQKASAVNNATAYTLDGLAVTLLPAPPAAAAVATTSFYTSVPRIRHNTAATAGSGVGLRTSTAQWFFSSTAKMGGFHFVARIGLGAITATNRLFVGMSATTTALSATSDISLLLNLFGFGADSAHTTWRFMYNDGSGTASMVDLGANFPCQSAGVYWFDFRLYCPAGAGQKVRWSATRLPDGLFASGEVTTDLPALNTLLAAHIHHSNGATLAVASTDISHLYIETDY